MRGPYLEIKDLRMTTISTPVLLLFGSGRNTGLATAKKFADKGYKVAAVSRHPYVELKNVASLIIAADMKDPLQVSVVFDKVSQELGTPHVVIYNGKWASQHHRVSLMFKFEQKLREDSP